MVAWLLWDLCIMYLNVSSYMLLSVVWYFTYCLCIMLFVIWSCSYNCNHNLEALQSFFDNPCKNWKTVCNLSRTSSTLHHSLFFCLVLGFFIHCTFSTISWDLPLISGVSDLQCLHWNAILFYLNHRFEVIVTLREKLVLFPNVNNVPLIRNAK